MVASRGRSSHGVEAGGVGVSAQEIADYYDKHQSVYSRFWSPDALHYGFWFGGTKNLQEATLNTNRFVARALSIRSTDHVLDAGCGVGGSSAYIAETSGARVTGVTLSEVQLDIARKRFAGSVAASRLEILKRNYCSTGFEDGEFSKIFGIESVCHANRKRDFLEEAWRLLSPGGRIAVVDAFLARRRLSPAEQTVYSRSMSGWVVPNLESVGGFFLLLEECGFEDIGFVDMQQCVAPSVSRIFRWSLLTTPVNLVRARLNLVRENRSAWYQRALFEGGTAIYGVFVARKPHSL